MGERFRIAAVTDDGETICAHFGRATHYAIVTVENGEIISKEMHEKLGHKQFHGKGEHLAEHHHPEGHAHGFGPHSEEKHRRMMEPILGCDVLLSRGMGRGAHLALEAAGIHPILTDISRIEEAVKAYLEGNLESHIDRLH
jgi:predicted Fe-Mo cluster-binding NifX family protein